MGSARSATTGRLVALVAAAACALGTVAGPSAGATTAKPGPQAPGVGRGSRAALAQSTCDAATKRTSFVGVGTGPWCVNPWEGGDDNGGATAPGVTADKVKVVVYYGNEAMAAADRAAGGRLPVNRTTGGPGTWPDNFDEYQQVYEYAIETFATYQTWGRMPVFEFVEASGADETAQRADALKVAAMKPFIVIDASSQSTGAPVFEAEMAKAKIIVNGAAATTLTPQQLAVQAPYRWATQNDTTASVYLVSNFLARSIGGRPAKWAGDESMHENERVFGLVTPEGVIDVDMFNALSRKYGGTPPAAAVTYDPDTVAEVARTLVAKLQSSGVTSVVLFSNNVATAALTKAATDNRYYPEWIVTGFQFQDFDGFARTYDQEQFAHAFGLGVLNPRPVEDPNTPAPLDSFNWYWGESQGTFAPTTVGWMTFIYNAIQYAGPKLTAENVQKGLFSEPASGGASDGTVSFQSGYGRTVGLPYDEYLGLGTDVEMIWWNPDLETQGTNAVANFPGKGRFMYLGDGRRYSLGQFPAKEPKFFDESVSIYEFPARRPSRAARCRSSTPVQTARASEPLRPDERSLQAPRCGARRSMRWSSVEQRCPAPLGTESASAVGSAPSGVWRPREDSNLRTRLRRPSSIVFSLCRVPCSMSELGFLSPCSWCTA